MERSAGQKTRLRWLIFACVCVLIVVGVAIRHVQQRSNPDRMVDAGKLGKMPVLAMETRNGNIEAVRQLLDAGANPDATGTLRLTALCWAVRHSEYEIAELLLQSGADPNYARSGDNPTFHLLLESPNIGTDEHYELLKAFLVAGANPADHDGMVFVTAAAMGDVPCLELLYQYTAASDRASMSKLVLGNQIFGSIQPSSEVLEVVYRYLVTGSPDWSSPPPGVILDSVALDGASVAYERVASLDEPLSFREVSELIGSEPARLSYPRAVVWVFESPVGSGELWFFFYPDYVYPPQPIGLETRLTRAYVATKPGI